MQRDVLLAGTTFLVNESSGDIVPGGVSGLFLDDTRHLSAWELHVDGERPRLLTAQRDAVSCEAVLSPATRRGVVPGYMLFRTQAVSAEGMVEELRLRNLGDAPLSVTVHYLVAADFADQFEVRSDREYEKPGGTVSCGPDDDGMLLEYRREWFTRGTVITGDPAPWCTDDRLEWTVEVYPGADVVLTFWVSKAAGFVRDVHAVADAGRSEIACFEQRAPETSWPALDACVRKGLSDLAMLRVPVPGAPELRVPGAGAPWFLTLYGRDSLITSLFALRFAPELAAATLRAHALNQGKETVPSRCEEPGKIVHEVRTGELSQFGQVPYARHYGTVDATPLFLMLLGAYHRQTGDDALVRELEAAAHAAVNWMYGSGGLCAHGYLCYPTDGPGFMHHGWKETEPAICFASGEIATGRIAVCEAQGYAFDALLRVAELSETVWGDGEYARTLRDDASALRHRFQRDFWLPDADFPALALDAEHRAVDALASNAGHLLWTGILSDEQACRAGRRLAGAEFFTGWGIRTIAAGQRPFHPVSYHNGSVWPHDTAIAVAGLARYGLRDEACRIAGGLFDAAAHFDFRLPKVMAGFDAHDVEMPVPYPHSCSPQAWAAAAPLAVHTALC